MQEQVGVPAFTAQLQREAPRLAQLLPQLPRLLHAALQPKTESPALTLVVDELRRTNRLLRGVLWVLGGLAVGALSAWAYLKWWT
jgi:ubiquinone biosynthesis protein